MPNTQTYDLITHERLAAIIAATGNGEEPVVSLYFATGPGSPQERRLALKNLAKHGEEQARKDTGFDDERKKKALAAVARLHDAAEDALRGVATPKGTFIGFARDGALEAFRLPISLRDRVVVERAPYTSPLSSVIEQYERFGLIMADQRRGRILEVYLGAITEWEMIDEKSIDTRDKAHGGGYQGLEDARRRHHQEYEVHRHLQAVADRAFAHWKRHGQSQLIVSGKNETLAKLIGQLHPYLRTRIVARESWNVDTPKHELLQKVMKVEQDIEAVKERALLQHVRDRLGGDLLATTGADETLRALYYGKIATLIVMDGALVVRGRECPECRFLMPREEDAHEHTPTLVECPLCKRPTVPVPDVMDQAVELAITSGCKVKHVHFAKDELKRLGGIASILRFR